MSTYEEKSDSNNVICPYCGYSYQCEGEDYCEEGREEECNECGKSFYMITNFTIDHTTTPDCELNGGKHKEETLIFQSGDEYIYCEICDKSIRLVKKQEKA